MMFHAFAFGVRQVRKSLDPEVRKFGYAAMAWFIFAWV